MSSYRDRGKKSWETRRRNEAVRKRKKEKHSEKLSKIATRENKKRKRLQKLIANSLRKWWKPQYLAGRRSRPVPLKCIVCGETMQLGLAIHHIDPGLKKGDKGYNAYENQAPICGTCHNVITYKKSKDLDDILNAIKSRHEDALKEGRFKTV